jgi:UDP-N-acetylmuramate dehydrogenase
MLKIEENYPLKNLNTFGFDINARYFVRLTEIEEIKEFIKWNPEYGDRNRENILVLGCGSNLLFTNDYNGYIIKPEITGIEITNENSEFFYVRCGAGVVWDKLVEWTVEKELCGLENLSHIPGTVGASPVQNIGAYGVEVKDCLESVEGYSLEDGTFFKISNSDCKFGYRTSILKTALKGKVIITHVNFKLLKQPNFTTNYGSLALKIAKFGSLNLNNVRQAIIKIRSEKLPDPAIIGNAGSFFKNPIIAEAKALQIKETFQHVQIFKTDDGKVKIPAAFLIEKCGWKGFRDGDAGVHAIQPLVLVNYGNAKGEDIFKLAQKIKLSVKDKFNIDLEMEVNVV